MPPALTARIAVRRLLAALLLAGALARSALAYQPAGWVYMQYPYGYDHGHADWMYFDTAGSTWVCNLYTGSWYLLGNSLLAHTWTYWQWPYAYSMANGCWYFTDTGSPQWCRSMASGQWSLFGAATSSSISQIEQRAFQLVNEHRMNVHGLPALSWNSVVGNAARGHSQNMASGAVPFGHDGYYDRQAYIGGYMTVLAMAENVTMNAGYSDPAAVAVQSWIDSSGHHANMIGSYDTSAIGVALAPNGTYYFTQIFVRTY